MPVSLTIKRGDIYDVDWGKDAGFHPALIIQNDVGNERSNSTIVAYISHTMKDYPVLVNFKEHESSLEDGGAVNLGRIMTIPKTMLGRKRGRLSSSKMLQVNEAIKVSLGLD
jgi:mRNA interferase MazF